MVGHSLTSNSNVAEWWGDILGEGSGYSLDTTNDFVVCCNYLGSPYGTSSPVTPDPDKPDGTVYAADFPTPATIRDNVRLQRKLLDHLGVKHLRMAIGGVTRHHAYQYSTHSAQLCWILFFFLFTSRLN